MLFREYHVAGAFDEMFGPDGEPRAHYVDLYARLARVTPESFADKASLAGACYLAEGITFAHDGREQTFPFDLLPRLVTEHEWRILDLGLRQRSLALDLFLADVYGAKRAIHDGVVPNWLVVSCRGYMREMVGIEPPNGRWVQFAGIDLIRDDDGGWRVLEDNLRTPSGLSYVVQNRAFMRRVFPEAFAHHHVAQVDQGPLMLREALAACAPDTGAEPCIVVLSPGPLNPAYYEHAFLAQQMGVQLVEGRDLVVRDRRVLLKTTSGYEPVDVIYRRIDDWYLDPVCLRSDSLLGVSGMMEALRAGRVAVCNAPGAGVADDKAINAYVPDLIRYFLAEEPVLNQVPTYLLERDEDREYVLAHLDELVVKSVDGAGGYDLLIGPHATAAERDRFAKRIVADPRRFIAQQTIMPSRAPVFLDGRFQPRHVDLRPFVTFGKEPRVVPGGLTRVALREGSLVVNSSQGGGSKDTWVLAA